jgi:DNA-binding PadR family transcriptional regulator
MSGPVSTRTALLLGLREGPGFGLDLIRGLARRTGNRIRLAEARVYPTLQALEKEGLVMATRVSPGGGRGARSRTYYELTVRGVLASGEERETLTLIVARRVQPAPGPAEVRRMAGRLGRMDELSETAASLRAAMLRTRRHGPSLARK